MQGDQSGELSDLRGWCSPKVMRKYESNHSWVNSSCDLPYWSLDPPFYELELALQYSYQTGSLVVGQGQGLYPYPLGHPGSLGGSSLP